MIASISKQCVVLVKCQGHSYIFLSNPLTAHYFAAIDRIVGRIAMEFFIVISHVYDIGMTLAKITTQPKVHLFAVEWALQTMA